MNLNTCQKNSLGCVLLMLLCLVGLYAYRPDALQEPPYWDALMGPLHEAVWLARNDFNYASLASDESGFLSGGPNIYFFSAYPSLQAFFIRMTGSSSQYLLVTHLFGGLCAGGCLAGAFLALRRNVSWWRAFAVCLVLGVHPLFLSQAYAVNMEMPMTCMASLGLAAFAWRRNHLCAAFFLVAFFMKFSAALPATGLAWVWLGILCTGWRDRIKAAWLMLPLVLMFVLQYIGKTLFNDYANVGLRFENLLNPEELFRATIRCLSLAGDSFMLMVGFIVCGLAVVGWTLWKQPRPWRWGQLSVLRESNHVAYIWLGCLLGCGGMALMAVLQSVFLARYMLLFFPFMLVGLFTLFRGLKPMVFWPVVLALFSFNIYNHEGAALRLLTQAHIHNNGDVLERSMEYVEDMEMNRAMMAWIDEHAGDRTIITSWPYLHMLAMPELGYVDRAPKLIASEWPAFAWAGVQAVRTNLGVVPKDAWWLYSDSAFFREVYYQPEKDTLIHRVSTGRRELILFQKGSGTGVTSAVSTPE